MSIAVLAFAVGIVLILAVLLMARRRQPDRRKRGRRFSSDTDGALPIYFGSDASACSNNADGAGCDGGSGSAAGD